MNQAPVISVVVPVYRDAESIRPFLRRLEPVLENIGPYEVLFCIDPSPDATEETIRAEIERNSHIGLIVMSRRFGQPSAVIAGILNCRGENCVVIDVDLQDPPEVIAEMYEKRSCGYEVVYATRRSRRGETLFKRLISYFGYKVINAASDIEIPRNTGDFRLISRRVIEELRRLKERHGFLRGLVAFVGFRQCRVEYDRNERAYGSSKYNRYLGSIKIGLNGLIGFSNSLLTGTLIGGIVVAGAAFVLAIAIAVMKLAFDVPYPLGVPTVITLVLFMGGVQLICIGIVGEYVGRIYDEVKQRPQYIVDHAVNIDLTTPDNTG